jgi:hypothetical protein
MYWVHCIINLASYLFKWVGYYGLTLNKLYKLCNCHKCLSFWNSMVNMGFNTCNNVINIAPVKKAYYFCTNISSRVSKTPSWILFID